MERDIHIDDFKECVRMVIIDKCTSAINTVKLNKSSGLDGLTFEFDNTFKIKTYVSLSS